MKISAVILGLDPRIQTSHPPDWIPASAGMTRPVVNPIPGALPLGEGVKGFVKGKGN